MGPQTGFHFEKGDLLGFLDADGTSLLIGDTPEGAAVAIVHILQDAALRQCLRESGRQITEQSYNWHIVYQRWDEVYQQLNTVV